MDEEEELKHKVGTGQGACCWWACVCTLPLGWAAQAWDPRHGGLASLRKSHPEAFPSLSGTVVDLCKSSWHLWVPGVGLDPRDEVGTRRPWGKPSAR